MLTDLLTALVLAFVAVRLGQGVQVLRTRPDVRSHWRSIVAGLRPRHFLMAPPVLAVVLVLASLALQVPGLNWGWWTAIGGRGNPVVGATDQTTGTPLEWLLPLLFVLVLIPLLPLFAEREEQMFRDGAETWSKPRRVRRAVEFGLAHALIGIPIGVALALSVGGLYFTWRYLRGGIGESTRAHLAYNIEVVVIVLGAIAVGGV